MRAPALIGICLVTMAFVGFQDVVLGSPESAVEKSVRLTQEEIDFLLAQGAQPDDVRALEAERDELMTQLDDPPPRLPDPGEVQRILMHTPSEPDWDSGEIQCEGSLALRDIEFESAPRVRCRAEIQWQSADGLSHRRIASCGAASDRRWSRWWCARGLVQYSTA